MMGSTSNKTGPWVLDRNQDLTPLIDKLNDMLPPQSQVHLVRCDTASMPRGDIRSTYDSMHSIERVQIRQGVGPSDQTCLYIPIGTWIVIPTRPLMFEGKSHPAILEIMGDHITVTIPYLFKEKPDRVDMKSYAILPWKSH